MISHNLSSIEPVKPTLLGSVQCFDDADDENAVILRIEYDAVPRPDIQWSKDKIPLIESSKIEVFVLLPK